MEKLIELLNEWEFERVNHNTKEYIPYWEKSFNDLTIAQVISKKFWFIKWLVDNDKIDFDKLEDNSDWFFIDLSDNYLEILALLSIQDNPIEFLVSILK